MTKHITKYTEIETMEEKIKDLEEEPRGFYLLTMGFREKKGAGIRAAMVNKWQKKISVNLKTFKSSNLESSTMFRQDGENKHTHILVK